MSDISVLRYEELPQPAPQTRQQRVSLTWGKRSKKVTGVLKLVQTVIKLMLTTPGTDKQRPELGTPIQNLFRRGIGRSNVDTVKLDISIGIEDVARQIIDIQSESQIPASERLSSLNIARVEFSFTTNEWFIDVEVLSEAGEGVSVDIAPFLVGK